MRCKLLTGFELGQKSGLKIKKSMIIHLLSEKMSLIRMIIFLALQFPSTYKPTLSIVDVFSFSPLRKIFDTGVNYSSDPLVSVIKLLLDSLLIKVSSLDFRGTL